MDPLSSDVELHELVRRVSTARKFVISSSYTLMGCTNLPEAVPDKNRYAFARCGVTRTRPKQCQIQIGTLSHDAGLHELARSSTGYESVRFRTMRGYTNSPEAVPVTNRHASAQCVITRTCPKENRMRICKTN